MRKRIKLTNFKDFDSMCLFQPCFEWQLINIQTYPAFRVETLLEVSPVLSTACLISAQALQELDHYLNCLWRGSLVRWLSH
jgi:hypothetical protein